MKTKPKVLVLKTDGINCDEELEFAFNLCGADAKLVHVNELRSERQALKNFQILAIPGGFSYGDDVTSGKILAIELTSFFSNELKNFIQRKDTLTIGICNGFQVLIRSGILPFDNIGKMDATLLNNDCGHFECRWVNLKIDKNTSCVFLKELKNISVSYQVAHGEGKFFAPKKVLDRVEKENLVAIRYIDSTGKSTQKYPDNPNGSLNAIAGITNKTGRVLGIMPHPERFVRREHHPNFRRMKIEKPDGLLIFESMIEFVRKN